MSDDKPDAKVIDMGEARSRRAKAAPPSDGSLGDTAEVLRGVLRDVLRDELASRPLSATKPAGRAKRPAAIPSRDWVDVACWATGGVMLAAPVVIAVRRAWAPAPKPELADRVADKLYERMVEDPGPFRGPAGEPGKNGLDGKNGKNGLDGKDGKNGKNGLDGKDGKNGLDGRDGATGDRHYHYVVETPVPGPPGRDGLDGLDGRDGRDGKPGPRGPKGAPGREGRDGRDGRDGKPGPRGPKGAPGRDGRDGKVPRGRAKRKPISVRISASKIKMPPKWDPNEWKPPQ
jgi:hypothetical protein